MSMEKKHNTIAQMAEKNMIAVDYSDDNIAIIDSVNELSEMDSARTSNNLIAIVKRGKAQMKVNGRHMDIGEDQIFICPPNTSLTEFEFSSELEFQAMVLTDSVISEFLRERRRVWNDTVYVHKTHVMTITKRQTKFLSDIFNALSLLTDTEAEAYPYREEGIRGLVFSAITGICGMLTYNNPDLKVSKIANGDKIFQSFLGLLNDNKVHGNRVEDYASRLSISSKYLSTISKSVSGKTAKEWIRDHTMEEIRYYLMETDMNVKDIAIKTGFGNASFFCKYVKQNFGMTPLQIRLQ